MAEIDRLTALVYQKNLVIILKDSPPSINFHFCFQLPQLYNGSQFWTESLGNVLSCCLSVISPKRNPNRHN